MRIKFAGLVSTVLFAVLLMSGVAYANRGLMVMGPAVAVEEVGQNAIVAWNGSEEVIILSADVRGAQSGQVLEVLPLPSNPGKISEGKFSSFRRLTRIINKKAGTVGPSLGLGYQKGGREAGAPGVQITFQKHIGAHRVTVVKINDVDYFARWVDGFARKEGFAGEKISPDFRKTVNRYVKRNIRFFAFDVIEVGAEERSIKPLIYKFRTDSMFYPLEITSTSDAGESSSRVNLFLLADGVIEKKKVERLWFTGVLGFDRMVDLNSNELAEVSPDIAGILSSAYAMNVVYYGPLADLDMDLVVRRDDVHIPTQFDRLLERIPDAEFVQLNQGFLGRAQGGMFDYGFDSLWETLAAWLFFLSLLIGIPSVIVVIGRVLNSLLTRYKIDRRIWTVLAYLVQLITMAALLLLGPSWLVMPALAVIAVFGFSMIIFLLNIYYKCLFFKEPFRK